MPNQNTATAQMKMPAVYIPHGAGPCFFMDWQPANTWHGMAAYLKGVVATLPQQPKAIVMVSAHWLDDSFAATGHARPKLIYDYYGFPPHTYELTYPAAGAPELAARVQQLLEDAGIPARTDAQRGFDHGMFIPLKLMFPDANIPVIQLALQRSLDPQLHLQAGAALASLRDEGVLIVGSGMSFHNMRGYGDSAFTPLSEEFDQWLTKAVTSTPGERNRLLTDWTRVPQARACHPAGAEEHLLPLMVVTGAAGESTGRCVYTEQIMKTAISAYHFG